MSRGYVPYIKTLFRMPSQYPTVLHINQLLDFILVTVMENQPATKMASDTGDDNLVIDLVVDFVEKEEDTSMSDPGHVELKEKHTLSNPGSSSDEEVDEGGEGKKRKKKGLKDKIKDKISRDDGCKDTNGEDHKLDHQEAPNSGEKKGFLDKIIEKLPGQHHNRSEEGTAMDPPSHESPSSGDEKKEKKGIFDKIKEKLPGHHKNDSEAKKDK